MTADGNEVAERILAEAEKVLGISGPKYTVTVDGHLYRLMSMPEEQPALAAATFADMLYMVRHWLKEHPDAAAEMSEYGVPMDDQIHALPLVVQMSIFLGLALEIYGRKHSTPADANEEQLP